ncbi:MAG: CoA-acylating methylmalonate-semialdehyde dehydrogenase [Actinobacteria bacterium]|nr:CoA-acylating methylmalonate-semialdehyde dehydrogenase [Actinomycetota bacterium]
MAIDLGATTVLKNYCGGRWIEASSGDCVDVWDPATGDVIARTPLSNQSDLDRAVDAAAQAFELWSEEPPPRRAKIMFALQRLLQDNLEELAELIVLENGKGIDEARGDVQRGLEVVEFAAGAPTLLMGGGLEQVSRGIDTDMYRYPLGVVAGVTPFNFPAMIPLWMMPVAIVCGNTFILKPSQRTPLTAARLVELFEDAGLPAGVLNLVHGAGDTVDLVLDHPGIRAVSFVGSAAVARHIYARAAANGKRVQALAGAKNHMVLMPDADLDFAAEAMFSSAFSNGGQRCLAGSVGVAVGGAGDKLIERLAAIAGAAKIGSGIEPDSVITPVTTEEHRQRVSGWIDAGAKEGARVVVDGRVQGSDGGFWLGPTVLDGVRPEMSVAQEEIFGPVLVVQRSDGLDEAIETINRSHYGNAAVLFTRDGGAARRFRRRVHAGMIGINIPVPAPMAFFPFSGWKGSFYGDLHATGRDGIDFYTERKVITTRWPEPPS